MQTPSEAVAPVPLTLSSTPRRVVPVVIPWLLFLYALFMLGLGAYAFLAAPPDAQASTALAVPGACAGVILVVAGVVVALRRRRAGLWAAGVGGVLAIAFAVLFLSPAVGRFRAMLRVPAIEAEYRDAVARGVVADTPEVRREFFREPPSVVAAYESAVRRGEVSEGELSRKRYIFARNAPSGEVVYLIVTLWSLKAVSWVFGVATLTLVGRALRNGGRDGGRGGVGGGAST